MSIPNQNVAKLHHYDNPDLEREFAQIYNFLQFQKYPQDSINGKGLKLGSTPENRLRLPLTDTILAARRTDAEIQALIDATVFSPVVTVITTAYTIKVDDMVILVDDDVAAAAVTITLPTAASGNKHQYIVKKLGTTATVTVDGNLSETIDDSLTQVILVQYDAVNVVSDGTAWWII